MRKIKGSNNYLKNQVRGNLAKAALSIVILIALFAVIIFRILSTFQVTLLEQVGLVLLFVPLIAFNYYLRKSRIYGGGLQGEKQVAKLLNDRLSDDYYLINSLYLQNGGGDIDHVVLGPSGVFVLETKNWNGKISCNGDEWQRQGKRITGSPSRQVKRNASTIRRVIESSNVGRGMGVWVEGIVVFTNKKANLAINNTAVAILKLPQLPNHIASHPNARRYTRQELETLADIIVSG